MTAKRPEIVDPKLVGEVWPMAAPAADPVLYGHAHLSPTGDFEVRSVQCFTLTYTAGRFGLDDNGAIRIVFRFFGDWGSLQTTDPTGYNYVTAITNDGARPALSFDPIGHSRPWLKTLTVRVRGGYLSEGDTIIIKLGDTEFGSPGLKMQTMVESAFEFRVLVDACAVGHFHPIPESPAVSIIPGPPVRWIAVLPTLRKPGEPFRLGIKAEDLWGNPSDRISRNLRLETDADVKGLPEQATFKSGEKSLIINELTAQSESKIEIKIFDQDSGELLCEAGPLLIRGGAVSGYWGDMHGQSGETIGITSAVEYFHFARDLAFLDATGHQANDFQINNVFWEHINKLTTEFQEDGKFVTFPGYEWSGNTSVGGDRNVYFREEGRQIRRSSHALLPDQSDIDTDANDAKDLFRDLANEDCVIYAHVGGRFADVTFAHDPKLETAMEIHSAWGTFEWLLTDGFPLGHRCGVVCNSDGHKGRPGASYPGASMFGAYGGLTCFLTEELTRDSVFDCLRKRHHYGTTGNRLHLDVRAECDGSAQLFDKDPNAFDDATSQSVSSVIMGDIAQTNDSNVTLRVEAIAGTPIERIEIRNGMEVVETVRPYNKADLGVRYRVIWQGAEYRGRGRQTNWSGRAKFSGAAITRMEKINAWNHERLLSVQGSDTVVWDAITTGNYGGFDVWLDDADSARLEVTSNHGNHSCNLLDIGLEDTVIDCGGLERKIRIFRLPDDNPHRELTHSLTVDLAPKGDNPLWVCVTTEDGFQAWSSPIFLFK